MQGTGLVHQDCRPRFSYNKLRRLATPKFQWRNWGIWGDALSSTVRELCGGSWPSLHGGAGVAQGTKELRGERSTGLRVTPPAIRRVTVGSQCRTGRLGGSEGRGNVVEAGPFKRAGEEPADGEDQAGEELFTQAAEEPGRAGPG